MAAPERSQPPQEYRVQRLDGAQERFPAASRVAASASHCVALYGNVAIEKARCPECGGQSFVRSGRTVCCGATVSTHAARYRRETHPADARRRPPPRLRRRVLEQQGDRCFYCHEPFGATHWRRPPAARSRKPPKARSFTLRICWDHRVPYSWSKDNGAGNFVAACHVCNALKSDFLFRAEEEARGFLADRRKRGGYDW